MFFFSNFQILANHAMEFATDTDVLKTFVGDGLIIASGLYYPLIVLSFSYHIFTVVKAVSINITVLLLYISFY